MSSDIIRYKHAFGLTMESKVRPPILLSKLNRMWWVHEEICKYTDGKCFAPATRKKFEEAKDYIFKELIPSQRQHRAYIMKKFYPLNGLILYLAQLKQDTKPEEVVNYHEDLL